MAQYSGHHGSPSLDENWMGQEYGSGGSQDNMSPDAKDESGTAGLNFLQGFSGGVQKKMTRDGQPAKRRGPKPDSKPAQTRRQELNRQAQRTHRERKEQYIKALESEISRLRESYTNDISNMHNSVEEHREALKREQEDNGILRQILAARGVAVEQELAQRRAAMGMKSRSQSLAHSATGSKYGMPSTTPTGPTPGLSPSPPVPAHNHRLGSLSATSAGGPGYSSHGHTPEALIQEQAVIKQEPLGISAMPGIFEKQPDLCVDFILALEATCRDHGEYLIRRSVTSPDDSEETQFSGHALMASCPPPTHISNTPAQMNGLVPTYPHKVPDIPLVNLNTLLNLSQQLAADGNIEGGQVTPIMALQSLRTHDQYGSLTRDDVISMVESVKNKVRCYGFGAVMEDFELRDALSSIFATKYETYAGFKDDFEPDEGFYS